MPSKLPLDSIILVTGANGFVASHICDQLLSLGYHVRGTVRDIAKNAWLKEYFDDKYGGGKFELVQVPDFTQEGAFDEAVKGCSAFCNTASDMNQGTDPIKSVEPVIRGVKGALASAAKEPGIKTFVHTSSSTAATRPIPNKKFHIGKETWNEADIKEAWDENWTNEGSRLWAIYGASKTQGEKAVWEYLGQEKPSFSINTILPNANFGPILVPEKQQGSTAAWIKGAYVPEQWQRITSLVSPQYYVDVQDDARLHAALLTDPGYNEERLFAFAEPFSWNGILANLRELTPNKKIPEDLEDDSKDLSTVENERALEILKAAYGQPTWTPILDSLKENVKAVP